MKKGILAGILVGLGAFIFVSLYPDNKPLGAFLFSLGLISVFHLQANLYTGKIGSISHNN